MMYLNAFKIQLATQVEILQGTYLCLYYYSFLFKFMLLLNFKNHIAINI